MVAFTWTTRRSDTQLLATKAIGSYGNLQGATLSGNETATVAEQWFY